MKVILASLLLAGFSAIAAPKVGDKIEMSIEYAAGSASRVGVGTIEITKIELGKAHLVIDLKFEDEDRQVTEEDQNLNELGYIEDMAALKELCEKNSGELGTGEVDGQSIDVCTVVDGDNVIKHAVVPFGLYEVNSKNEGMTSHLKLLKYLVGQ